MKIDILLVTLIAIGLSGCKSGSQPTAGSTVPHTTISQSLNPAPPLLPAAPLLPPVVPKFGWKVFQDETFETTFLESRTFALPTNGSKLSVKVKAGSAIFGGVFPQVKLATHRGSLREWDFKKVPCSMIDIDEGTVTCEVNRKVQTSFVIRDKRAEGSQIKGLFNVFKGGHALAEHAMLPNKIHLVLATWQCVENCKKA